MVPARPAILIASFSALALFIETPSAAQASLGADHAQEIVVTAQRRPEAPQDVPISLTVMTDALLERMQVMDTSSLDKLVPSLVMMRTGAFTQPYLRGVGKRSTLGVENSTATYIDGIYLASSVSALLDLRGIERVEVLKGPQGTLFGRNTTGGVIQIVTREPDNDPSGDVVLHAGNYGYMRGDLYATGGNGRLGANLALSLSHNDGYGTNLFTGKTNEGEVDHSLAGRGKLVWRPTAQVKFSLAADYQDSDHDFSVRPVAGYRPIGQPRTLGFRDGDQDAPTYYRFKYGGVSLRAEADLGSMKLVSLSGLRRLNQRNAVDLDLGPLPLLSAAVSARQGQFSHEFQLQSSAGSRFEWIAGVYYIHIDEKYDPTTFSYGGSYSAGLGGRTGQALFARGTTSSIAAFGQATARVGDATRFSLGLRYTIERRTVRANGERTFDNLPSIRPIPGLPLITDQPFRNEETFREPSWRASVSRDFSDELMGYVSASRGFQSGGWNLQTPQNPAFGPERLDALEAGAKYADRSHRFSADASIFYYDYSDLQLSAITPIGNATVNAASAEAFGLELQVAAALDRMTEVNLGAQLMRAKFKRFANATCIDYSDGAATPYAPVACDVTGNHLPFAPELKLNFGASRKFALHRAGSLIASTNIAYSSGYFSEVDNVVRQDSFATWDASLEWRMLPPGPSVRLWALNLTDAEYYDSLVTFPTTGVLQRPAAPRRMGVSLGYAF